MEKEMLLGKLDFRAALSTQRKSEIMIVAPVFARTHTISSNTFSTVCGMYHYPPFTEMKNKARNVTCLIFNSCLG